MKKTNAIVLALVGLQLIAATALSGCASPEPVFDISVVKVEQPPPGPPLPGTPPSLPLTPEPHPTEVQQVFLSGDTMYVFIVVNPRLSKSVSFSKYTIFNRQSKSETELPPNGSFGPYNPGMGFAVAYEEPWTVPAHPGNYEFRVYIGSKVVASARFDVAASPAASSTNPIEVVSVSGPIPPPNPGGPEIEVVLKNASNSVVVSLKAELGIPRASYPDQTPYPINFEVSTANPLPSGQTISARTIAIGGGFQTDVKYPLTISGKLQNGNTFDYTVQVSIVRPTGG